MPPTLLPNALSVLHLVPPIISEDTPIISEDIHRPLVYNNIHRTQIHTYPLADQLTQDYKRNRVSIKGRAGFPEREKLNTHRPDGGRTKDEDKRAQLMHPQPLRIINISFASLLVLVFTPPIGSLAVAWTLVSLILTRVPYGTNNTATDAESAAAPPPDTRVHPRVRPHPHQHSLPQKILLIVRARPPLSRWPSLSLLGSKESKHGTDAQVEKSSIKRTQLPNIPPSHDDTGNILS